MDIKNESDFRLIKSWHLIAIIIAVAYLSIGLWGIFFWWFENNFVFPTNCLAYLGTLLIGLIALVVFAWDYTKINRR